MNLNTKLNKLLKNEMGDAIYWNVCSDKIVFTFPDTSRSAREDEESELMLIVREKLDKLRSMSNNNINWSTRFLGYSAMNMVNIRTFDVWEEK